MTDPSAKNHKRNPDDKDNGNIKDYSEAKIEKWATQSFPSGFASFDHGFSLGNYDRTIQASPTELTVVEQGLTDSELSSGCISVENLKWQEEMLVGSERGLRHIRGTEQRERLGSVESLL